MKEGKKERRMKVQGGKEGKRKEMGRKEGKKNKRKKERDGGTEERRNSQNI